MIAWCLLAAALAASPEPPDAGGTPPDAGTATAAPAGPTLRLQPGTAKPGDPVLVMVEGAAALPSGKLAGRALHFYRYRERTPERSIDRYEAISALPVEHALGTFPVVVKIPAGRGAPRREIEASIDVVDANYPKRELQVDRKFISPPPEEKERIAQDQEAFKRAWQTTFGPRLFHGDFEWPRHSVITAPFGDLRMFNGKKKSQHFGTDLDGSAGEPIQAANDGVVVLVRECFASGNTVIVNHGGGLLTAYFHMSKFLVEEGKQVKKGEIIGLVGKTGRVTGPHLHWSIHADGLYVDAQTLMRLDFGA
ncbi:MAG TPA: M23 family metallopeptidase [Myxococcales bacterium]|nr:M23 family metallopeptidase [Myxococcales bacterium]